MKILLAIALLVSACGGTSESPNPTTQSQAPLPSTAIAPNPSGPLAPAAEPTPSPTPSPTPDPEAVRKAAGAAYLVAVKPYNKALNALNKKYAKATALKSLKAFCVKLADNEHAWLLRV